MEIDDRFIDVDFEEEQRRRKFFSGSLPVSELFGASGTYEDRATMIPRSDWEGIAEQIAAEGGGLSRLVTRIFDQGQEGACVSDACSQAHEIKQAKQFGKENVIHLSAISLYKRIGRSPSSGASVSDGLDEMSERGILPLDDAANRARFGDKVMPNTGFHTKYPSGWEGVAKSFRSHEWDVIRTMEGLGTALLNQQPVVVGRQRHSICYVEMIFKTGKMLAPYPNSWGIDWGQPFGDMKGGFGFDTEGQIKQSSNWAFTLRSIVVPE